MSLRLKRFLKFLLDVDPQEITKVVLLSAAFFLIIGSYTISKELKDAVFTSIIGAERIYLAYAKVASMLVFIPLLFLHSKLVDWIKKHQLLYVYTLFFGIIGLILSCFLASSTFGLANQVSSPYRIFGWLFYFFVEAIPTLLVGVFWAFVNSITDAESAKGNYSAMIAGSKIGGILTAGSACWLLRSNMFSDAVNLQILLGLSSFLLLFVPVIIYILEKVVPKRELHGYEAAYRVDKQIQREAKDKPWFEGMVSGLVLLFKYPYVMGIFGMTFFFELVNQVIKVENILFGKSSSSNLSVFTDFLLLQALLVHIVGFFVVIFGTRTIMRVLGEKRALVFIPVITGISVLGFLIKPYYLTAVIAFVVTRAVNYALAVPLRESLYIPTIKEIKFKTKSWIDGMGSKFAKMTASSFNACSGYIGFDMLINAQAIFLIFTIFSWIVAAYALGKKFEKSVEQNEVIGSAEVL